MQFNNKIYIIPEFNFPKSWKPTLVSACAKTDRQPPSQPIYLQIKDTDNDDWGEGYSSAMTWAENIL